MALSKKSFCVADVTHDILFVSLIVRQYIIPRFLAKHVNLDSTHNSCFCSTKATGLQSDVTEIAHMRRKVMGMCMSADQVRKCASMQSMNANEHDGRYSCTNLCNVVVKILADRLKFNWPDDMFVKFYSIRLCETSFSGSY